VQLVYLFKGLELSPVTVQRVVAQVPESAYDERRDPERFSFREAVAHLTDWEAINLERVQRGVAEPGCTVPGLDEAQRAIDLGYASLDPNDQAKLFGEKRLKTLEYLRTLADMDWEKVFYHSERGRITVLELTVSMLGHDVYHLEQFAEYMGKRELGARF
jgi:hypothetical protein